MGFRTVVVISNDRFDEIKDEALKDLIQQWWGDRERSRWMSGPYRVVEQVHCDHSSLLSVLHLDAKELASVHWDTKDHDLSLLKNAADKLGYRLVKKAKS